MDALSRDVPHRDEYILCWLYLSLLLFLDFVRIVFGSFVSISGNCWILAVST